MLKLIHRFQKTIVVYIVIFILCASMLIFGIDAMAPRQNAFAVKVGDTEISFDQFSEQRQAIEQRYAAQFGNNMAQLGKLIDAGVIKPNQEALDRVIPAAIFEREAVEDGFVASPAEVKKELSQNFTADTYRSFLQTSGRSAQAFESQLAESLRSAQFASFLGDMAYPAKAEVNAFIKERDTTRDIEYASFKAADFEKDVGEISKEQQESYFTEHSEEFETPDKISYNYITIAPKDVENEVEIIEDDIELYYSENEKNYTTPAKAKLRQILFTITFDMPSSEQDEKKKLAEEVLGKALAGEDFTSLAQQYSDDINTNMLGGDMGWVSEGELAEELEEAAFGLKGAGVAPLIETDEGFHVVKVDEYQSETTKSIDEVRAEIESIIRTREAPAYAAIVAQDLFDQWQSSDKTLEEFVKDKSYELKKSPLASKEQDPAPTLKGLTDYMLQFPDEKMQYVERGDIAVLAEVTEFQERDVPKMEQIADRISEKVKKLEARKLAQTKAEEFKALSQEKGFATAAKELGVKVEQSKSLGVNAPLPAELQAPGASDFINNTWTTENAISPVYENGDTFSVVNVVAVKLPEVKEEQVEEMFAQLKNELQANLTQAFINQRKSEIEIDIDPGLLVQ